MGGVIKIDDDGVVDEVIGPRLPDFGDVPYGSLVIEGEARMVR
jgi:hypothetical protein